jgi:hypothetical protein
MLDERAEATQAPVDKMTQQRPPTHNRPLGIYIVAMFMFLAGSLALLAAIVLPLRGQAQVPWYIYLAYAAYLLTLGWGLWGGRRWAYLAALLMCVVLAFEQLRAAVFLGQDVLIQLLVLAAIFGCLIRPRVRQVFLGKPASSSSETDDQQTRIEDRG